MASLGRALAGLSPRQGPCRHPGDDSGNMLGDIGRAGHFDGFGRDLAGKTPLGKCTAVGIGRRAHQRTQVGSSHSSARWEIQPGIISRSAVPSPATW